MGGIHPEKAIENRATRSLGVRFPPFAVSAISLLKIRLRELFARDDARLRDLNLRFDAVRGHLQREIECIHAILEIKRPADQRLHVDLPRAHQR
jgi:hypothetical protein